MCLDEDAQPGMLESLFGEKRHERPLMVVCAAPNGAVVYRARAIARHSHADVVVMQPEREALDEPDDSGMPALVKQQLLTLAQELPEDLTGLSRTDALRMLDEPRFAELKEYLVRKPDGPPMDIDPMPREHLHKVRVAKGSDEAEHPWERHRGDRISSPSAGQKMFGRGRHFNGKR